MSNVRTRFAPSPTGFLHIGGARTALFAWLYARAQKGQFILRVEDTDRERSTEESIQAILDGMHWLGLDYDEGPFFQMDRLSRYHEEAQKLLEAGHAYRCTCSHERLEAVRADQLEKKLKPRYDGHCRDKQLDASITEPFVVRFKNPVEGEVSFVDEVYGPITVHNSELDDLVMLRTDGIPTYNFAVVIDDWDMAITHVIRGDDHINNTPRQINLLNALSAPIPIYAHLPMILGDDGKRLSKRHGAVSVMQYRDMGYLPHAVLNYIVRLGWSHGDQEIFSIEEMIKDFNLSKISKGSCGFNTEKCQWINQHYLKTDEITSLVEPLTWHFLQDNIDISTGPSLLDLLALQRTRVKTLKELADQSRFFYDDTYTVDEDAVLQHLNATGRSRLALTLDALESVSEWTAESITARIKSLMSDASLKMPEIALPLRVAISGSTHTPGIGETLALLGRDKTLARIRRQLV